MPTEVLQRARKALETLNRNRGEDRHTTPSGPDGHYSGWYKWDADFVAIVRARSGDPDGARQEIKVEGDNGHSEQKNPLTGKPVRERTSQNFSWGTLFHLLAIKRAFLKGKIDKLTYELGV